MHRTASILFCTVGCLALHAAAWAGPVVIQHPSANFKLSPQDVKNLYLGNSKTSPDGRAVVLIAPKEGKTREAFLSEALGKSESQYRALWSRLTFTGVGQPPKELATEEEVRKAVAANPSLVGYIDDGMVDGSVKPANN